MNNIFDTHAHYDDEKFNEDRKELLASFPKAGISGVINCGCDIKSSVASIKLAEEFGFIYAAVGIHAHEASEATNGDLDIICELLKHEKAVAVGEIGLDYYYDFSPREVQIEFFENQILIAKELDMPIIVHDRDAHEDTLNILKKYKPKGAMHCFSGSTEMAKEIISIGMYIGLGGAVTFKNAKKPIEVARFVPADKLLIETDAPYMTPVPFRGKRNDSTLIPYSAKVIAETRGVTEEEILKNTEANAKRLFKI